ncbi:glycosyltransferase [Thermomonospora cellulosilytica]|uniref:Glycosyltransferase involved in cell wall biosynthesis n=1 Tax=Thermomonospora cellulosilytica TaxID=1411118 RepID=A0A7W3RCI9_9ACTN|nr:glycosyltransferase [Thermomonospora cellulosilytica]MBA9007966.1 glycosyltransferase involved in cell wall biosynthesis [Thermomonospora cellulosilytica]
MRVLVCTVRHHPEDARVLHRQIRAMLDAGHSVTYAAPFRAWHVTPWRQLTPVDVPRAGGRGALSVLRAVRRALAEHVPYCDVLLLHDPELTVALPRAARRKAVVVDVHEAPAGFGLPGAMSRYVRARAGRRHRLVLASPEYRAEFGDGHPVVPDVPEVSAVPPAEPDDRRVVHVGRLSAAGGALEVIEMAGRLADKGVAVELIGGADPRVRPALRAAQRSGALRWYGFVPYDRAMRIAEGAMAGLALPPGSGHAPQGVPVKVMDYMAHGIPVVASAVPAVAELVGDERCGLVVPPGDVEAALAAVLRLRDEKGLRARLGRRAYETARERFDGAAEGDRFVRMLEEAAGVREPARA